MPCVSEAHLELKSIDGMTSSDINMSRVLSQVLSFVLDAVRAEAFNEKRTLFLFGSYTIGKEKLFLEVAHTLKKKVNYHFA